MHIVSEEPGKETVARRLTAMRGQDEATVRPLLAELAAKNAGDANVIRSQAWFALLDGKWKECADLFEKASKQPFADFDVEERATCLHAGGRHDEALQVAASVAIPRVTRRGTARSPTPGSRRRRRSPPPSTSTSSRRTRGRARP